MNKDLYPREIILETTNHCNLRCRFCHFHAERSFQKRPKGFLSPNIWEKVFADIESWSPKTEGVTLCLHGAGEPLLHPHLREILQAARKIPGVKLGFMTNAMLLDEAWTKFLVSLPLDWLWFSVDGARPETNDFFRRGARLSIIEKNIRRLIKEKEKRGQEIPQLFFNMVAYPEVSEGEKEEYLLRWLPYAGGITISRFRPLASKKLLRPEERAKIAEKPCPLLYRQMVIAWDGRVGLCCEDINVEYQLGHVEKEGLLDIFNGPQANRAREAHEKGKREEIALCRECEVWAAEEILSLQEQEINGRRTRVFYRPSGRQHLPL